MKKTVIILCSSLFLGSLSTAVMATPFPEPQLGITDSTPYGRILVDANNIDGENEVMARDNIPPSEPFNPYYWGVRGLILDSVSIGDFVIQPDGTATVDFSIMRKDGTFGIFGDHLWGHDPGTIYAASIQGSTTGTNYFNWDNNEGRWISYKIEGDLHWWGDFISNPSYSLDVTADFSLGAMLTHPDLGRIRFGDMSNVQIEVTQAPVPEPATMFLFGTGLAGLAGFRLRRKKK